MEVRHLQALVAIADHRTFSAAADHLGTVQSNISAHVARLEQELGAPLVDRANGHLTEEGRVVVARARRVLCELEALVSDVAACKDEVAGTVRVGMIGTTARWLVPQVMEEARRQHPKLRLVVVEGITTGLEPQLANGQLDLAILNLPVPGKDLVAKLLFEEDLVLVVPQDHPLALRETPVQLAELADLELLLPLPGTAMRRRAGRRHPAGGDHARALGRDRRAAAHRLADLRGLRTCHPPGHRHSPVPPAPVQTGAGGGAASPPGRRGPAKPRAALRPGPGVARAVGGGRFGADRPSRGPPRRRPSGSSLTVGLASRACTSMPLLAVGLERIGALGRIGTALASVALIASACSAASATAGAAERRPRTGAPLPRRHPLRPAGALRGGHRPRGDGQRRPGAVVVPGGQVGRARTDPLHVPPEPVADGLGGHLSRTGRDARRRADRLVLERPHRQRHGAERRPNGSFPVVLFSHGYASYPEQSSFLTEHLAQWGFIVAAPDHRSRDLASVLADSTGTPSGSSDTTPVVVDSDIDDLDNTLDYLRQQNETPNALLEHHVDMSKVGVLGHSSGGGTAVTMAGNPAVRTYVALAPVPGTPPTAHKPGLVMDGSADMVLPPSEVRQLYDTLPTPKRLIVIKNTGHNVFDDICTVAADGERLTDFLSHITGAGEGLTGWATNVPDGCNPPDVFPTTARPLIDQATTAQMRSGLGIDEHPVGLGPRLDDAYPGFSSTYSQDL